MPIDNFGRRKVAEDDIGIGSSNALTARPSRLLAGWGELVLVSFHYYSIINNFLG